MIIFLGDIHGEFDVMHQRLSRIPEDAENVTIIQVGDFGFYPKIMKKLDSFPVKHKLYAIDGNHENFNYLSQFKTVTEVKPNIFYVPRGSILQIDGYRIGFCGGGFSPDKNWRTEGIDWFIQETITSKDVEPLYGQKLDILVTHTPPVSIIMKHFGPLNKKEWNLSDEDYDSSSHIIEYLWRDLGCPQLFCGHMHRSVVDNQVRILDIGELYTIPDKSAYSLTG